MNTSCICLQEVDISGNNIGPQGFRAIILGLCNNSTITSLNISNNMADTDSSVNYDLLLFLMIVQ